MLIPSIIRHSFRSRSQIAVSTRKQNGRKSSGLRWACLGLALFVGGGGEAAELWVAPNGADSNPGTREQPLASPARALRLGRELKRLRDPSVADGVRIILRGGEYSLSETLLLRPEDGGTESAPTLITAAPDEQPVLTGALEIDGWRNVTEPLPGLPLAAAGKVWVADVPAHNGRVPEFRQLWINGQKAVRARTPGPGAMTRLVGWDRAARVAWIPADTPVPAELAGVEMVLLQMWEIAVLRIRTHAVEGGRARITFWDPESRIEFEHPWPQPVLGSEHGNSPFFLTNAIEFLDEPGEWYLDRQAGRVYYWPREGEELVRSKAVVPVLETLVQVAGNPDQPVQHLRFDRVGFAYTTWLRPSMAGHVPLQAGFYMLDAYGLKPKGTADWRSLDNQAWLARPPAAIQVTGAQHLRFDRCRIEHAAANGLDWVSAVQDSAVEATIFRDIGINGLMAGEFSSAGREAHLPWNPRDEREVCARLQFKNNFLTDCANEDWGGVALIVGFVRDTVIAHNEITNTSYTGISVGWGWTRTSNAARRNTIHANLIHKFATRMSDTAGIYTLSAQPGTVVSENAVDNVTISSWVHDPEHWFYLYADEGTAGTLWRDNWCPAPRFLQNANGPDNLWENNGPQVDPKIRAAAGLEPAAQDLRP